jgi:uncharacterized protein
MNRLTILLALALCFPLAAHADEASRRAKAEQLIDLLHVDRMVTQVMNNVLQQTSAITTQRSGGTLTPETKAALDDFQKKLVDTIEPQIGWKALQPEYVRLYAEAFTDEQLDGMIAFYKSPAGTALREKMPGVNQQANQLMQSKVAALQPQVKQMFEAFQKSLPEKTSPPAAAPPAAATPAPTPGTTPK